MFNGQNPSNATHPSLHLRDAADAHVVFEAVRLGILPLIKRRLTSEERDYLTSGNVFVWEEAEHKGGLERWTDGRRWSQSRMKGDYLFYEEKIETTQEEKEAKAARRANRVSGPPAQTMNPVKRQDRPTKPNGLTKQTYSTHVWLPGAHNPRKWHIVAYFAGNDYSRLPVIDNFEYLQRIRVPEEVFLSSKGTYRTAPQYTLSPGRPGEDFSSQSSSSSGSHYDPASSFSGTRYGEEAGQSSWSRSPVLSSSRPYHDGPIPRHSTPGPMHRPVSRLPEHSPLSLPGISTVASFRPHAPTEEYLPPLPHHGSVRPYRSGSQSYSPLSPEDRKALDTFRVVL